jgi:hypothetical protein
MGAMADPLRRWLEEQLGGPLDDEAWGWLEWQGYASDARLVPASRPQLVAQARRLLDGFTTWAIERAWQDVAANTGLDPAPPIDLPDEFVTAAEAARWLAAAEGAARRAIAPYQIEILPDGRPALVPDLRSSPIASGKVPDELIADFLAAARAARLATILADADSRPTDGTRLADRWGASRRTLGRLLRSVLPCRPTVLRACRRG